MHSIFLSYSRSNRNAALMLQKSLESEGVKVWRDQESIYAGEMWPKSIGEGIANQTLVVLIWSFKAANSYFIEFEWNTAIALEKLIIPILIDNASLPDSLRLFNAVEYTPLPKAVKAIKSILDQLEEAPSTSKDRRMQVLKKLKDIQIRNPKNVVEAAKTIYIQEGWTLTINNEGKLIQNTGGGTINIYEGIEQKEAKKKWNGKRVIVFLVVVIFVISQFNLIKDRIKDLLVQIDSNITIQSTVNTDTTKEKIDSFIKGETTTIPIPKDTIFKYKPELDLKSIDSPFQPNPNYPLKLEYDTIRGIVFVDGDSPVFKLKITVNLDGTPYVGKTNENGEYLLVIPKHFMDEREHIRFFFNKKYFNPLMTLKPQMNKITISE